MEDRLGQRLLKDQPAKLRDEGIFVCDPLQEQSINFGPDRANQCCRRSRSSGWAMHVIQSSQFVVVARALRR